MPSLNHIAASQFMIPLGEISDDTSPRTVMTWDSLRHIEFILSVERAFGVRFAPSEVPLLTDLGSVRRVLLEKGVGERHLSGA